MRRAKRIHNPGPVVAMGDERTDADNRVVDVFRKLVADRFAHFIVRARVHAVRCGVAAQIGHSFEIPDDDAVAHDGSFAQGHALEKPSHPTKRCKGLGIISPVGSASGFYLLIRTPFAVEKLDPRLLQSLFDRCACDFLRPLSNPEWSSMPASPPSRTR